MSKTIKPRLIDTNILSGPIVGKITEAYYAPYFNRKYSQVKFGQTFVDYGWKKGTLLMVYPLPGDPSKIFITEAIDGEEGRILHNQAKKQNQSNHKLCMSAKRIFDDLEIAEQPPSGRGRDGKGEKGFYIQAEFVQIPVRGALREGFLIDMFAYQKPVEYEKIEDNEQETVEA